MLFQINRFMNQMVVTLDGENLGEVRDIYFDDKYWTIRYFVVNTGAWPSKNLILVSPHSIVDLEPLSFQIKTGLTREQLENAPFIEEDAALDINLRSYKEIIGYKIRAQNEEFGNVEELIFEEESFIVRFLVINTISYWPSKSVLMSPDWIDEINWQEKVFVTQLLKDAIKSSPPYNSENLIDRIYEKDLFKFYKVKPYWDEESKSEDKVEGWIPGIQEEIARNQASDTK